MSDSIEQQSETLRKKILARRIQRMADEINAERWLTAEHKAHFTKLHSINQQCDLAAAAATALALLVGDAP